MPSSIEQLNRRIDELTERLARMGSDSAANPEAASGLLDELAKVERDRRRLLQKGVTNAAKRRQDHGGSRPRPVDPVMPVRERALAGLELLSVPARGGLVSLAAEVRTGLPVETRQLASLRRSELASWRSAPDRRPAYVVPGLHDRRFEPLRGVVAASSWEPWRRLIGPLSLRADHLRATIRVGQHIIWAREHSEEVGARLERLLWRLARSVPGVLDTPEFDVERVVAAARAELSTVGDEDRALRDAAASRLERLTPEQRLFGAGLRVIAIGSSSE